MKPVRVGLVGSQFVSTIHAEALKRVPGAELFAVVSPTGDHAEQFARRHGVRHHFRDYRRLLEAPELDLVVLGCPNDLHCEFTELAAAAGKHIVCEKPLCLNLSEADRMLGACARAGVKLMYAEELCFTPKYVRLKRLLDEGALGRPYLVKQCEKHDGPHAGWFWDVQRSGGGVTMDMGCHAIEFFRWLLAKPASSGPASEQSQGKASTSTPIAPVETGATQTQSHEAAPGEIVPLVRPQAVSVYAEMGTFVHGEKTEGEDNAVLIIRFQTPEGEVLGIAEESWAKKGGMDDTAEIHGSGGVAYADLLQGNAILTYSEAGHSYAVEKAGLTRGWSFTAFEELWNYGFPQEFAHFVDCVASDRQPLVTGEDGRAVLEIIMAAYASAGEGRKVTLPFQTGAQRPIDLWKPVK